MQLMSAPGEYLLHDPSHEAKYEMKLAESVTKAKKNARGLFKNYQVYVSTTVPSHTSLQKALEVNGGEARIVSHNTNLKGRSKIMKMDSLKHNAEQLLIVTENSADSDLKKKFTEEIQEEKLRGGIRTTEWVMQCILRQEILDEL
jgi:BRCT domain, a BRCA1 C-terminus domain